MTGPPSCQPLALLVFAPPGCPASGGGGKLERHKNQLDTAKSFWLKSTVSIKVKNSRLQPADRYVKSVPNTEFSSTSEI